MQGSPPVNSSSVPAGRRVVEESTVGTSVGKMSAAELQAHNASSVGPISSVSAAGLSTTQAEKKDSTTLERSALVTTGSADA